MLSGSTELTPEEHDQTVQLFSTSPALFIENLGQWEDGAVRYGFTGSGTSIAFTDDGLRFDVVRRELAEGVPEDEGFGGSQRLFEEGDYVTEATSFSVSFDGAAPVRPVGLDVSDSRLNFCVGDQSQWASNVPSYETVGYLGVYCDVPLSVTPRIPPWVD